MQTPAMQACQMQPCLKPRLNCNYTTGTVLVRWSAGRSPDRKTRFLTNGADRAEPELGTALVEGQEVTSPLYRAAPLSLLHDVGVRASGSWPGNSQIWGRTSEYYCVDTQREREKMRGRRICCKVDM